MKYERDLNAAQTAFVQEQSHVLWGGTTAIAARIERLETLRKMNGAKLPHYAGLISADGLPAASFKWYDCALVWGGKTIRTMGFGAVFTQPEARHRGYAKALMEAAMADAASMGYEAALLYSDIDPAYYAKMGFQAFDATDFTVPVVQSNDPTLIARKADPQDAKTMRAWYDQSYAGNDWLRLARDHDAWNFYRVLNGAPADWILADPRTGKDIGYASTAPCKDGALWLEEWAAPDVPAAQLWAAMHALAAAQGKHVLRGWLRRDDPCCSRFERVARTRAIPMVKAFGARAFPAKSDFRSLDHF